MKWDLRKFVWVGASSLLLNASAFAAGPGFYMGLMTGPATNDGTPQQAQVEGSTATTIAKPRSKQWGTRFFMGNKFSPYAGWEGGVTFYTNISYDTEGVDTCSGLSSRVRDLAVMARGSFPFRSLEVFGKAGVAWAYTNLPGAFFGAEPGKSCGQTQNKTGFKPVFSVGMGYDLSPNWVVDLSLTRTMIGGIIKNVDFFGVGISYHFVDVYCGQFLCDY